jgi:hypothetical protein
MQDGKINTSLSVALELLNNLLLYTVTISPSIWHLIGTSQTLATVAGIVPSTQQPQCSLTDEIMGNNWLGLNPCM